MIEGNSENGINHEIEPNPPALTNGNHEHNKEPEELPPRSPRTPKTPPKQETPTEESASQQKRSSTSSSRGRSSASSRPTTGYGKNRTGSEDQPQGNFLSIKGMWIIFFQFAGNFGAVGL